MSAIAIITARGGSKRIPKKNIKDFCGKPIIAYTIEAALKSGVFDVVMVSTDSEEIAEISKKYGAEVPFLRSAKTSDDFATTEDVIREVLDNYQDMGQSFEYLSCLYPTAPFITPDRLKEGMELLLNSGAESLNPVVEYSFPPARSHVITEDGRLKFRWPENCYKRSQDLEPWYHDAGQFYFYKTEAFLKKSRLEFDEIAMVLNELEVQDIDNETDWQLAELKYKLINNV